MRTYPTRKDQIIEKIDNFLADKSRETLSLLMYSREIRYVSSGYPTLTVEQGEHYKDTALWVCTIRKQ